MEKVLRNIVVICLVLSIGFITFKYFNRNRELDNSYSEIDNAKKVFEDPEMIVYQIKGKEKFRLTKEDEEFNQILNKLNWTFEDGKNTRERRKTIIRYYKY